VAHASARYRELVAVVQLITNRFTELWDLARDCGVGQKRMGRLKEPLQKLNKAALEEIALLKEFLRKEGWVDWNQFMLDLISRAIDSGFRPTIEEQKMLDKIRAAKRT
jgi:hypothetical protein